MAVMKTSSALTAATLLSVILLTGCGEGRSPSPTPTPEPSSVSSTDTGGGFGPTIGINGKVGVGYDLGGGLVMSPGGSVSFGVGF